MNDNVTLRVNGREWNGWTSVRIGAGRRYGFSFGFAASICLTVSMGKNPVGKIILSTFYPSWSAAVNDLKRTMTNCESTEGLIFRGFCGLVRMGAN